MKHLCLFYFIFSIFYKFANLQKNCGNFIPKNNTECFDFSDLANFCCYFSNAENTIYNHCKLINRGEYLTYPNTTWYSGVNVNIDCGETHTINNRPSCGSSQVSSFTDCTRNSTKDNSCCYYNHMGKKGCVLYDLNVKDSIILGNVIIQCESSNLSFYNLLSIFLILIIFLF